MIYKNFNLLNFNLLLCHLQSWRLSENSKQGHILKIFKQESLEVIKQLQAFYKSKCIYKCIQFDSTRTGTKSQLE